MTDEKTVSLKGADGVLYVRDADDLPWRKLADVTAVTFAPKYLPVLLVGQRLWFSEDVLPFTVQAVSASGRFVVATKPFAARRTVLYTMLDLKHQERGVDNTIGNSLGYETRNACQRAVDLFESGEYTFSSRRRPIPIIFKKRDA